MMRANRSNEVMPDVLPSGLRDIPLGDEAETVERMMQSGPVDIEEVGLDQVRGFVPRSIARDAMDPAEVLPRNMRLAPRRRQA